MPGQGLLEQAQMKTNQARPDQARPHESLTKVDNAGAVQIRADPLSRVKLIICECQPVPHAKPFINFVCLPLTPSSFFCMPDLAPHIDFHQQNFNENTLPDTGKPLDGKTLEVRVILGWKEITGKVLVRQGSWGVLKRLLVWSTVCKSHKQPRLPRVKVLWSKDTFPLPPPPVYLTVLPWGLWLWASSIIYVTIIQIYAEKVFPGVASV